MAAELLKMNNFNAVIRREYKYFAHDITTIIKIPIKA
jgi:hypothetical protein